MSLVKEEVRHQLKNQLVQMDIDIKQKYQKQICQNLQDFFVQKMAIKNPPQGVFWGAYKALPYEANIHDFLQKSALNWAFPQVEKTHMDFYFGSNFIENSWGLLQPDPSQSQKIALASLAGLLIPGLAFDLAGGRLGHGQGYYDRFLLGYTGLKVGICFSFQILSQALVLEPHDQKVDFIITENSVHEVSENCTQLKECS